jgi:undecaprenyl-diphosphatase
MNYLTHSDKIIFKWLFGLTAQRNCLWVKYLSKTGDGPLYLLFALSIWYFAPQHGRLFVYSALLAYSLELPVYLILKNLFKRQRPFDFPLNWQAHITPSDKFSLPSGHTAAAFLMASLIANYFPTFAVFVYLWAMAVGCSRVLLGVHYPSDIIAGAALGVAFAHLSMSVF